MKTQSIIDAGDLRKYFTQIPNMVDDAGLTVYEFRLYAHLKRVAGDRGRCWQGTETLAASCNMSGGSISKAKHGLKEKGLISIEKKTDSRKMYHEITVIDVWPQNFAKYSLSPDVLGRSRDERHPSPGERKKNSIKKNIITDDFPYSEDQIAEPTELDKRKARLSSTFWTTSRIPEPSPGGRGWNDWQDGLDQLIKIDAAEAEITSAVKILDDNKYSYGSPGSLVKTIVNMRKADKLRHKQEYFVEEYR